MLQTKPYLSINESRHLVWNVVKWKQRVSYCKIWTCECLNCPYLPGNNIAADNNNTVLKIVTSKPNLYINTYRKKHNEYHTIEKNMDL